MDEYAFSAEYILFSVQNPQSTKGAGKCAQHMKAVGSGRKERFCCAGEFLRVQKKKGTKQLRDMRSHERKAWVTSNAVTSNS